jgi:hypothetical protein
MAEALILLGEERRLWMMVGARGLSHLMPPSWEVKSGVAWVVLLLCKRRECNLKAKGVSAVLGLFTPVLTFLI